MSGAKTKETVGTTWVNDLNPQICRENLVRRDSLDVRSHDTGLELLLRWVRKVYSHVSMMIRLD